MNIFSALVILNIFFLSLKMVYSFGWIERHRVNGNGLPYNFPFIPDPFTPIPGQPTFPPSPPIDPRINQPLLAPDRLNSMLNVMLNAQNLVIPTQQPTSTPTPIMSRIGVPEVVFDQN